MKLLASDFDGTLIHHQENKSYISERVQEQSFRPNNLEDLFINTIRCNPMHIPWRIGIILASKPVQSQCKDARERL